MKLKGITKELPPVAPFSFTGLESVKNLKLEDALVKFAGTPITGLCNIFSPMLKYSYKYIDVKVHKLKAGNTPCIPGWHLDGGFEHSSDYILMVSGVSLTDFNSGEYEYIPGEKIMLTNARLANLSEADTYSAKDWTPYYYDNTMPHRGTPARCDGSRFLFRIMSSTNPRIMQTPDFKPGIY